MTVRYFSSLPALSNRRPLTEISKLRNKHLWILPERNCPCTETREGQTDIQTKRNAMKDGGIQSKQNHLKPQTSAREIVNMVHLLFYHSLLKWLEINTSQQWNIPGLWLVSLCLT